MLEREAEEGERRQQIRDGSMLKYIRCEDEWSEVEGSDVSSGQGYGILKRAEPFWQMQEFCSMGVTLAGNTRTPLLLERISGLIIPAFQHSVVLILSAVSWQSRTLDKYDVQSVPILELL